MKKTLAILLSVLFIFTALPSFAVTASAEESVIEDLVVKPAGEGEDISDLFNYESKRARDDTSGKIYRITIVPGTYTAGSQLNLWSNTWVCMEGVTIERTSGFNLLRFGYVSDLEKKHATGYDGFSNIKIEGGTFDGGGYANAITQIGHSKDVTFSGITFKNVGSAHMIELGGCSDVTIDNCTFRDFTGKWDSTTNYEAVQLEIVTTRGHHFSGYPNNNDETPCKNISVTNCTFKNLQRGVGAHTGIVNSYLQNIIIEDNKFENITGFAIIATNFVNSRINKNIIENCGSGINYSTYLKSNNNFYPSTTKSNSHKEYKDMNTQIKGNTIEVSPGYKAVYSNVAYGVQLTGKKLTSTTNGIPAGDFRCSGVTVADNEITLRSKGYGIWLIGSAENTIDNNTVTCNITKKGYSGNGDPIRIESSYKNTVSNNIFDNITSSGSYDKELTGISVLSSSNSNTISKNTVKGAKKDGIKIESSSSNKVLSNTVVSPKRDGIRITSAKKTKAASNTIKKPANDGILVEKSASSNITGNTITKAREGINLKSSKSVKIVSNKVSSSKSDGIKLLKSNSATINKNKLLTQKRDGIFVDSSSSLVITGNTIKSSARYGILASKKQIKKDKGNKITKSGKRARSWK